MRQKINLKRRKGNFKDQVWPHQHPAKWKGSLAEELQISVPKSLSPVDSFCADMWEYYKQQ